MLLALDEKNNTVRAMPGCTGRCPICDTRVIAKCGAINPWHWAHCSLETCDTWAEGETDWHLGWKQIVADIDPSCVERTIREDGKTHRADICVPWFGVIEIQHSPISTAEIIEREEFYGNMTWIFDAREAWKRRRLDIRPDGGSSYDFRWRRGRKTLRSVRRPLWLDLGTLMFRVDHMGETCSGWGQLVKKEEMKRMIIEKIRDDCDE